jgi:small subunit ribosomal protein S6
MRLYEVVYILDPALDEGAVEKKLEKLHELITGSDGEVTAVDHWGPRQLAYPIRSQKTGYYAVAQVMADPQSLGEFERVVKLDDDVMRYLLVLNEGEPITAMSLMAETPPGREEAGEEIDEDEEEEEDEDDDSPPEFQGGRGRRRRHEGPRVELLNYKDIGTLSRFLTEEGKILPRRTTKVDAAFQRQLGQAVKRARYLALIPYVRDHEA